MRRQSLWAGSVLVLGGVALLYLPVGDFYLFLASKAAASLLAVAGLNLALGFTGLFSFAHVSLYALGAYTTSIAVSDHGLPVWAGFLLATTAGVLGGCLLSLATFRAKASHFAVVSLVLMFTVSELLGGWKPVTHGAVGLNVRRPALFGAVVGPRRYWLLTLVVVLLCTLAIRNFVKSPLGRGLVALRESEAAAASVGINPFRYRMLSLGFGGAIAAIGGALFAHLDGYISPELAGFVPATSLVVSLLLGGPGTLWGPVLGVGVMIGIERGLVVLQRELPGIDVIVLRQLISGGILFAVIVFMPRGIGGALRWIQKMPRRPEERRPSSSDEVTVVAPRRSLPDGPVLEAHGLTKHFGGVRAVDGVDLTIERGTIHGLIGPNGSGKTTTINLLTGVLTADFGSVRFLGEEIERPRPDRMAAKGVGRVFQRAEVFAAIPAIDNVLAGFHLLAHRGMLANLLRTPRARRREVELREQAFMLLTGLGLGAQAGVAASALPYGDRRLLELARALASRPALLILDEPATGLTSLELAKLSELLTRLRRSGTTVLLIEHNMEFVMDLCDRVTVLNYGRKIAEGTPGEIQSDTQAVEAYLGVAG